MRVALSLLVFSFVLHQRVLGLPAGFRDEGVAFKSGTTGFAFVPKEDGGSILLICQRKGEVVALLDPENPSGKLVDVLDMEERVCNQGERGVSQIIPHPDFLKNRYVYLSYTYDKNGGCKFSEVDGPVNVVSRFRLNNDLKMVDEKIILQTTPLPTKVHNGGDMKFGNDGYLYVTLGNGGKANEYGNSQKSNTLLGSIIRITDDGNIPPDNPFTDDNDRQCGSDGSTSSSRRCSEIWCTGFRNPFRFAMNPNEKDYTQFYVNDVGGATWEEISEVTSKSPGKNYGYREMEGPCDRGSKTKCKSNEKYEDPLYWYEHNNKGDGCVSGGAFVPNGIWPKEYDNKYMFADFIFKKIFILSESRDGCRDCSPPRPDFQRNSFKNTEDTGQPVQLTFGPYRKTQALYYSLWAAEDTYSIRRIIYEGGESINNKSPDAEIKIEDKIFNVNEDIVFDGSGSSDPDGNQLSFKWDFGDGGSSIKEIKTKSYGKTGKYTIKLTVSDGNGFEDTTSETIIVGTPPTPVILYPEKDTTFAVNDVFTLYGYATDSDGNSLSDLDLTWEVRQVHSTHYHPYLVETVGNEIVIPPAPSPEDFDASTNSFLKILLTATDSNGLTRTTSRDIMPKTKKLRFKTDPPGLELTLDGFKIKTPDDAPLEVISWVNHNLVIDVEDQGEMIFESWSTGIRSRHREDIVKQTSDDNVVTAMFARLDSFTGLPTAVEDYSAASPTATDDEEQANKTEAPIYKQEEYPFSFFIEEDGNATESQRKGETEFETDFDDDMKLEDDELKIIGERKCSSIYDTICENINLVGFCQTIQTAGLKSIFDGGVWTIFAPDDGAIFKAPESFHNLIRDDTGDKEFLRQHLLYHSSPNNELKKENLPCRAGANLVAMGNGKDSRTLCDNGIPTYQKGKGNSDEELPRITEFDITACNGVIHIIDKVLQVE